MTLDAATDPLSYAASLLDTVGTDRNPIPAEVALGCLHAAELLELAGAHAQPIPLIDGDPRGSLRAAMTALSDLDQATFAQQTVLDAARAARRALRRLG